METTLFLKSNEYHLKGKTFVLPRVFSRIDYSILDQLSCVRCQEAIDTAQYRFLRFSTKKEGLMHGEEIGYARLSLGKIPRIVFSLDDLNFARLEGEVMYAGCGDAFELWRPDDFKKVEKCYWMLEQRFA